MARRAPVNAQAAFRPAGQVPSTDGTAWETRDSVGDQVGCTDGRPYLTLRNTASLGAAEREPRPGRS